MLSQNLRIENSLCNGTRLQIVKLPFIADKIITGDHYAEVAFLPRINLDTADYHLYCTDDPFL